MSNPRSSTPTWADRAKECAKRTDEKNKEKEKATKAAAQGKKSDESKRKEEDTNQQKSNKSNRRDYRYMDAGTIFIAEHFEEAGDQTDEKPKTERSTQRSPGENQGGLGQQASPGGIDEADGVNEHGITTCKSHARIVIKDRKWIVLFTHIQHYVCIPLFTYNRGGAKNRPDENDHVSVFDHRGDPRKFIQQSKWKPLETQMNSLAFILSSNAAARVTYPLSRPKNLFIEVLGHLLPESTERLRDLFVLKNELALDDYESDVLEAKHKDQTWTSAPPLPISISTTQANDNPPPAPTTASAPTVLFPLHRSSESGPWGGRTWGPSTNSPIDKTRPAKGIDWENLGKKRRSERTEGSKPKEAEEEVEEGEGGHSRESDDQQAGSDLPPPPASEPDDSSSRAMRRVARAPWQPLFKDPLVGKKSQWKPTGKIPKKRKVEHDANANANANGGGGGDDDEKGVDQPPLQAKSKRKSTKRKVDKADDQVIEQQKSQKKKRKVEGYLDGHDREGEVDGHQQPAEKRGLRRSGRKRVKVGGYAE